MRQSEVNSPKSEGDNEMKINEIFSAKKQRRAELAKLPIEEKVRILVQLQKIACGILTTRGIKKHPWQL